MGNDEQEVCEYLESKIICGRNVNNVCTYEGKCPKGYNPPLVAWEIDNIVKLCPKDRNLGSLVTNIVGLERVSTLNS